MTQIHPTALVDREAQLGTQVSVGPFCIVEAGAEIGDRCQLMPHAIVKSGTSIGEDCRIHEFAVVGGRPQHLRAGEQLGRVEMGRNNVIHEHVTIHRAAHEGHVTRLGDNNMLMVNVHVAHDCTLGSHVIITNNTLLGGHVEIQDRAFVSGDVAVHQFCRIGKFAMVGGKAAVKKDVPPFILLDGVANGVVGLNLVGLRRNGFSQEEIRQLKEAYWLMYRSGLRWEEVLVELEAKFTTGPAAELFPFLSSGKRGFMPERRVPVGATVPLHEDSASPPELTLRRVG